MAFGFIYRDPSDDQRKQLAPLAARIKDLEPGAVELLRAVNSDEDWPANIRHPDGIVLHQLGRHSGAACWAIRGAVARGWQRYRDVPSRAQRKRELVGWLKAAKAALGQLRTMSPHGLMALQRAVPDDRLFTVRVPPCGQPGAAFVPRLPARPDLDGKGGLQLMLENSVGTRLDHPGRRPA